MANPAVSIIMPVRNGERWIAEAIDSALAQTLSALELVVIDDGSTDRTAEIVTAYRHRDERVVLLRQPGTGAAAARNAGREVARGKWIASLDADDIAETSRLQRQVDRAEREGLVLVGSGFTQIDEAGTPGRTYSCPWSNDALTHRLHRLMSFFPHSSAFFSRDAANRLGGYRAQVNYGDDSDLWVRLSELGPIGCVEEPLVRIRLHGQQMTHHGGGRLQAVQACAAITAHFLRTAGQADPIASPAEDASAFVAWVERQMAAAGYFDQRAAWQAARARALAASGKAAGALRFGFDLLGSGHAPALLWQKAFGSDLPRRLAAQWVRRA